MAKLKLGKDFEFTGDSNEIKDLLANIGFDKKEILKLSNKSKIALGWFILPVVLFFIITCLLYTNAIDTTSLKIIDIASFFVFFWALIITHLKFKKWPITSLVTTGGIVIFLVARHFMTPLEATKKIEEKLENQTFIGGQQDTAKVKDSLKSKNAVKHKKPTKRTKDRAKIPQGAEH